jgi:hypothetical protein
MSSYNGIRHIEYYVSRSVADGATFYVARY